MKEFPFPSERPIHRASYSSRPQSSALHFETENIVFAEAAGFLADSEIFHNNITLRTDSLLGLFELFLWPS